MWDDKLAISAVWMYVALCTRLLTVTVAGFWVLFIAAALIFLLVLIIVLALVLIYKRKSRRGTTELKRLNLFPFRSFFVGH